MKNTEIFDKKNKVLIEKSLLEKLSGSNEFGDSRVIKSPRAVGDIVEAIISEELPNCFPKGLLAEYRCFFTF